MLAFDKERLDITSNSKQQWLLLQLLQASISFHHHPPFLFSSYYHFSLPTFVYNCQLLTFIVFV
jgi:hypothetical protein